MRRLLVIPAAGLGSRLGADRPKILVPVNGRPMLDRLIDLYTAHVECTVLVAHPSFAPDLRRRVGQDASLEVVEQADPTGMIDAILLARPLVESRQPESVWITWCDQVGVLPATIAALMRTAEPRVPAVALPTVRCASPYTHFERGADGRITRVLHRREADAMPANGESDMGLFALSRDAFLRLLPQYAAQAVPGRVTGERNFVPFVAWVAARDEVVTFPSTDPMEAIGINTPDDLRQVEAWLRTR